MAALKFRMWLLITILFGIIYSAVVIIGNYIGINNFYFYLIASAATMFIQYLIGPKIVEWSMHVKYVKREEYPKLYQMVESLTLRANIPTPKIGIAQIPIPNAFAFGRSIKDGRICVTDGILKLLNDNELKAVIGHELSHLKNKDVLTITILSVIPVIMYRIAWHFLFFERRRDNKNGNASFMIGVIAFLFYFITNLLVLYASRIREYFADRGSIVLGNQPAHLASALYKLVYGSAKMNRDTLKEVEGLKAFFVNDPSAAFNEIRELSQLDLDKSGTLDVSELERLKIKKINLRMADKLLETFSTHPNMLKRIKKLSDYNNPNFRL